MMMRLKAVPFPTRLAWLLPVALTLLAVLLMPTATSDAERRLLLSAVLFDATVSTAFLYWFTTPRPDRRLHATLGVLLRGVLIVALAFPAVRQVLWLELLGVGAGIFTLLRGLRQPLPAGYAELDELERAYAYWDRLTPTPRLTRMVLSDVLLWRGLFRRPALPDGRHFGTRRGSTAGATLTLLTFLTVMESLPVHFLLVERFHTAALWHLGLNAVSTVWLFAYARALTTRPVTVSYRRLYLRTGLHWTASTPVANVQEARPHDPAQDADTLNLARDLLSQPVLNVTLIFARPVTVHGLFGKTLETSRVCLHLDDPKAFLAALGGHPELSVSR